MIRTNQKLQDLIDTRKQEAVEEEADEVVETACVSDDQQSDTFIEGFDFAVKAKGKPVYKAELAEVIAFFIGDLNKILKRIGNLPDENNDE